MDELIELDRRRHASLEFLRPICISIMKDGSVENVTSLRNALPTVDRRIAQEIQQYILFPIQALLNSKNLTEALLCSLCDTLVVVFERSDVSTTAVFMDTFNPLMFVLTPRNGASRNITQFEETKISLMKAWIQLITASQDVVLQEIYQAKFVPALGQLVAMLLSFAELEKSREVQRLALVALNVVMQRDSKFGRRYKEQLGDFFPFCLPGVTLAMCRIATGDTKQGQDVITRALEVFTQIVTLILDDKSLVNTKESCISQGTSHKGLVKDSDKYKQPSIENLCVKRSEEWVNVTSAKVKVIVERLCKLVSSYSWKVRHGLACMCEELLFACPRPLKESFPTLLETLVGLIFDPYADVSRKATVALETISASSEDHEGATGRTVTEIIEENLHTLVTSLPRRIRMCDEDDKQALTRLLNGYIRFLGPNIASVINSGPHLSRLCLALVQALELDTKDLHIIEANTGWHANDAFVQIYPSTLRKPTKSFKHLRGVNVSLELLNACFQLGRYGDIHCLVDHMLDICQSSKTYRLAALLVINEMVSGAGTGDDITRDKREAVEDVISLLLDEYLSQESLAKLDERISGTHRSVTMAAPSLATSLVVVGDDRCAEIKLNGTNRNAAILEVCLYMEGLASFAKVLGKNKQEHLIRTLYPLVENLGHENLYISNTAKFCLVQVTDACGYSSLDSLLRENADYLVSSVSLRLRHFQHHRRTPQTLCAMLRYCSSDLLPLIRRSVTQLVDSLDENYEEDLVMFMPVLTELVTAIGRWFPPQGHSTEDDSVQSCGKTDHDLDIGQIKQTLETDTLLDHLTEYLNTKRLAEGDFSDGSIHESMSLEEIEIEMKAQAEEKQRQEKDGGDDEMEDEGTKETPPHLEVVKEVFQRVRNLLSTNHGRLRVQALDVVAGGFLCLRDDERELLPQVHQMWAGLRPLFQNPEKFVVIKAVKTLVELSDGAKDFLRQRVMKEVLPGLADFMTKQASISKGCHSGYLHTGNYKLQLSILSSVGPLAKNLGLVCSELHNIASICVPYLSSSQPQVLQQESLSAFNWFMDLDADVMWLLLTRLHCSGILTPPGPDFVFVQLPRSATKKSEYSDNVAHLIEKHYTQENR